MFNPNLIILFVDNPKKSEEFYSSLLGAQAIESSPTFAMFALSSGLRLGLWSRHTAEPATAVVGGGAELAFPVENFAAVDATHLDWQRRGLAILQAPTEMDFGWTFVALDPDGHRLRVFSPI